MFRRVVELFRGMVELFRRMVVRTLGSIDTRKGSGVTSSLSKRMVVKLLLALVA